MDIYWYLFGVYIGLFGYIILDKIDRSLDDGWLGDYLQKRREKND